MPQMDNVTVKAANGTTDVVYTALTPSAGDSIPAKWRVETASTIVANRPTQSMLAQDTTRKDARKVILRGKYPVERTINGAVVQVGVIPLELSGVIGLQFTQAEIDEAVMQHTNFCVSTLIRNSFKSGYGPT